MKKKWCIGTKILFELKIYRNCPARWIQPKLGSFDRWSLKRKVHVGIGKRGVFAQILWRSVHRYNIHYTGVIAQLPRSRSIHFALAYRWWQHFDNKKFSAPLVTVQICSSAKRHCQRLYVVNKRPRMELCAPLASSCMRWRFSFSELSQEGGWANFLKTSCLYL